MGSPPPTAPPSAAAGASAHATAPGTGLRATLPNALTLARLVLAALFFVVLSTWHIDSSPAVRGGLGPDRAVDVTLLVAAGLFMIAAITDALDGYLARRWNVVSVFGRVMDPFADKVLVLGAFILLAGPAFTSRVFPGGSFSCVAPWMAVVILARELLVTSLRAAVESKGVSFAATGSGKLKMVLQSVAVPLILVLIACADVRPGQQAGPPARWVVVSAAWGTVLVTAWSAVPYLIRAVKALRPTDHDARSAA